MRLSLRPAREVADGRAHAPPPAAVVRVEPVPPPALSPLERGGRRAAAFLAIVGLAVLVGYMLSLVSVVVVPLVLALFPAALLAPLANWLRGRRVPGGLAALFALLAGAGVLVGLVAALAPIVRGQLDGIREGVAAGWEQVQAFLASGPFGLDPISVDQLLERAQAALAETGTTGIGGRALGVATALAEGIAGLFIGLFATFFYLKDGSRIAGWVRDLFPRRMRADADAILTRSWSTVGSYLRGIIVVGLVDGTLIGVALFFLDVPLAIPLAVLTAIGALFPIIGALAAGTVAVLVALATNGVGTALVVLAIVVAVQQLDGDLLQPLVLGRALALHPLAILVVLSAGGLLFGILGAFLAVPVTSMVARAVGYLREQRGAAPHGEPAPAGAVRQGAEA